MCGAPCGARDCHFSRPLARPPRPAARCGIPAAVGRAAQPPILPCTGLGFSCRPPRGETRRALTPPFHYDRAQAFRHHARLLVFCDTVRHRGMWPAMPRLERKRDRPATPALRRRAANRRDDFSRRESCPMVSGLSSPKMQRTWSDNLAPKLRPAILPRSSAMASIRRIFCHPRIAQASEPAGLGGMGILPTQFMQFEWHVPQTRAPLRPLLKF